MRTVHHVDDFTSPSLIACQERSIAAPDRVVCVSDPWVERLASEFGVAADVVGNGVDLDRYRPPRDAAERAAERDRFGFGDRPVILTVGGIEPRKGSLTLLDAFAYLRAELPDPPLLVVAGGATLFDYRDEIDRWAARRAEIGLTDDDVRELGPVSDDELERLYRAADVLAFPSVAEGFGLVVLEALSAGLPVVASDIPVLRSFLTDGATPCWPAAATSPAWATRSRACSPIPRCERTWWAAAPTSPRATAGRSSPPGTRTSTRTFSRRPSGAGRGRALMAERLEVTAVARGGWATDVTARTSRAAGRRAGQRRRRRHRHDADRGLPGVAGRVLLHGGRLGGAQARDRGAGPDGGRHGAAGRQGAALRAHRGRHAGRARTRSSPASSIAPGPSAGCRTPWTRCRCGVCSYFTRRPFPKVNEGWMALQNVAELADVLRRRERIGKVFSRHAYGMRRWVDLFSARVPLIDDPEAKTLVAELVAANARHMMLFRERALSHGVDPDAYVCPAEGEVIYERIDAIDDFDELVAYALGSLDHFGQLLEVYAARRAARTRRRSRRARRQRRAADRLRARCGPGRASPGRRGARALPAARARRDAAYAYAG